MDGRALIPTRAAAVILLSGLFSLPARGGPVPRTEVRLEPREVPRGESARLTVSASWSGDGSELIFSRPPAPDCRGLAVTGTSQRSIAYREEGDLRQVREFVFNLRAEDEGTGRIGPVRLSYRERGEEEERAIFTEPREVPIVARKPPAPLPLAALIGAAMAAGLAGIYVRWLVRHYQKKSNEIISDYVENLESAARRELEGTRQYRLQGEAEQYCRKMRAVLLDYLEKRRSLVASPDGGAAAPVPGRAEPELEQILKRLDEYWFGSTREEMTELDDIYRRIDRRLRELEGESGD